MKKLNIIGAKTKIVEIEIFDSPNESEKLYAQTDGRGNYSLSNGNYIWLTDKEGISKFKEIKIDGNPNKLYKGDPELRVAILNKKLGVYDVTNFNMVAGPYNDMYDLLEDVYGEEDVLESKLKYLEFER